MEKLTEVLAMGGYAAYVWPSFIAAGLMMAGMLIVSGRALKRAKRALSRLQDPHEA